MKPNFKNVFTGNFALDQKLYLDKIILNKELKDFLSELIKTASTDYEKAKRIYNFCAEKIRYVAVEYGEGGYEPHKASEVFFNKYGDCKDQAILLVALLRGAGLEAWPVLIPTRQSYLLQEKLPASYFDHAIVCTKIKDRLIFMDPTSSVTSFGDLPFSDQNRKVLVFLEEAPQILTTPLLEDNSLLIDMDIEVKPNQEARIERRISSRGSYAASQRYYFRYTPPSLIREHIQKKMREMASFSELEKFLFKDFDSLNKNPSLEYSFIAYNLLSEAGQLRLLPVFTENMFDPSVISKSRRLYPVELGNLRTLKVKAGISLPDNLRVEYLPEQVNIDTDWFSLFVDYSLDKSKIYFQQIFKIKKDLVEEEKYPEFKKAMEEVFDKLKQQIILKVSCEKEKKKKEF